MDYDIPQSIYLARLLIFIVLPAALGGLVELFVGSRHRRYRRPSDYLKAILFGGLSGFLATALLPMMGARVISSVLESYEQIMRLVAISFVVGFSARRLVDALSSKLFVELNEKIEDSELKNNNDLDVAIDKIRDLERELKNIKSSKVSEISDDEIKRYLDSNIGQILESYLKKEKSVEDSVYKEIEDGLLGKIDEKLSQINIKELKDLEIKRIELAAREEAEKSLIDVIMQERRSSTFYKNVMINLFILINLSLVVVFFFRSSPIPNETLYSASGLYISLAMFIIYIFKVSNSRTSVLLAIQEDLHKKNEAGLYLKNSRKGEPPTEHDVDIIKMLLTNRSEREKAGDHPYEMVFKGIADSNIQLKGGKLTVEKK